MTLSLLAALGVAACGTAGTASPSTPTTVPTPTPGTSASATPATSPAPTTTPAPPTAVPTTVATPGAYACNTTVRQAGTVPIARITAMAVANDAATGRITFTFAPSGSIGAVPEVEIRPAEPPFTKDPSGLPLDVAGKGFLQMILQGGTALDDNLNPTYRGPFDFTPGGAPIVEVRRAGDFEAVSTFVVGVSGTPCARILPLDGSGRLVIEVQTRPGG